MTLPKKKAGLLLKGLFALIFLAYVVIGIVLLRSCILTSDKNSEKNLETGVVKIDIKGYHFNVPLRYMYGEAIESRSSRIHHSNTKTINHGTYHYLRAIGNCSTIRTGRQLRRGLGLSGFYRRAVE